MSVLVLSTNNALEADITSGAASALATALDNGRWPGACLYQFCASVASWIRQSNAGTAASAGGGSAYIPANVLVILDGYAGSHLSVIADGTSGKASLAPLSVPR